MSPFATRATYRHFSDIATYQDLAAFNSEQTYSEPPNRTVLKLHRTEPVALTNDSQRRERGSNERDNQPIIRLPFQTQVPNACRAERFLPDQSARLYPSVKRRHAKPVDTLGIWRNSSRRTKLPPNFHWGTLTQRSPCLRTRFCSLPVAQNKRPRQLWRKRLLASPSAERHSRYRDSGAG